MRNILVATDFSTGSDRAVRRGILIAKVANAEIALVNAVDDGQPQHQIEHDCAEAERLLIAQTNTLREIDRLAASYRVARGDPFSSIENAAADYESDLIVIGPHRRQILKDAFIDATAVRLIATSRTPVIMANAAPAAPYEHVLVAVDLSENSADAVRLFASLDWGSKPALSIFHAYDPPERALVGTFAMSDTEVQQHLADANARAETEVDAFLQPLGVRPARRIIEMVDAGPAFMIQRTARKIGADLIVVGRRGRSALSKLMLGSVAESVLRNSDLDVLAVPKKA